MGAVQSNLRRARGGPGGSQDLVAGMVVESLLAGEKWEVSIVCFPHDLICRCSMMFNSIDKDPVSD